VFGDAASLAEEVRRERPIDIETRGAVAEWVHQNHSFRARARDIMELIDAQLKRKGLSAPMANASTFS
jgi:hypothetical protein